MTNYKNFNRTGRFTTLIVWLTLLLPEADADSLKLYWGDIHNHNEVGYAKGSLERAYDIAQSHLDFFAFTGHAQWHDMPVMPENKHQKWIDGFAVLRQNWPLVERLAKEYYEPGSFVPLIAYEWHSSHFGDYCIYYPSETDTPLRYFDHVKELQEYAKEKGALIIPHHPAYLTGWRGANFDYLDPEVSPVVEFFSEHGSAEHDRGPYRYLRHSMGGRVTSNTMRSLLSRGVRVGVTASSDDHRGYPGAYKHGITGLYAKNLTREGIFEALRSRRTYAVTGDRIQLAFRLNGHWMGEEIPSSSRREISIQAEGWYEIDRIELIKNNRVIHRSFPVDESRDLPVWDEPVLCRIEFGWGPWGDLEMARICDWDFQLEIESGKMIDILGNFRSGPYDEKRRNRIDRITETSCHIRSYTSRKEAVADLATNSIVLKLEVNPDTKLRMNVTQPTKMTVVKSLSDLALSSDVEFTGPFTSESVLFHRLVFAPSYHANVLFTDWQEDDTEDWYYARVVQNNGDLAWTSPIWVNAQ